MNLKLLKRLTLSLLFASALVMTSCDKDDDGGNNKDVGTVSFSTMFNELINNRVKAPGDDIPDCSDAAPAYVDVVVTGPRNIGSVAAPYRVDLVNDGGNFITAENDEMTNVPAGDYQLIFFVVYDADNNPIWIAPTAGNFENFVEEPLPLNFSVEAGVDNVVSVDVLCFDNRILNEFGDLFFTLDPHIAIEFCIVGNTCGAGDASFSTSVWLGTDDSGSVLYSDMANTPGDPLCIALPDLDGEDSYYFEISVDGAVVRSGAITDADVKALFDGDNNLDPYIFYEGDACTTADSPDLFDGGGDDGGSGGGGTTMTFDIPYTETFGDATAESSLADYGYSTENLSSETVMEPGSAILIENTFPTLADETMTETAYGIQYGYVNNSATTSTGVVDNVVTTSAYNATAGDYELTYDVSYIKSHDNHSVEVYFSDDSNGSFENGTWTKIDEVSQADLDAAGVGRQEFQRRNASITTTGNFFVAFRFRAQINNADDGTRWRLDNIQVNTDSSGGSGGGTTFSNFIDTYEDFDDTATYDPSYLESNGYEKYALNQFSMDNNIDLFAETNGNYPSLADVTVSDDPAGSGFQVVFNGENDASNPTYGDIDIVLVSPGQAGADGSYTFSLDGRRFFGESSGTVTYYYSTSYTPGSGFTPSDWTQLGSDAAQDLNDGGSFVRKEFTGNSASGTIYFAVRVEASINDGGTATAGDGNYRFRVRFDNLQIREE